MLRESDLHDLQTELAGMVTQTRPEKHRNTDSEES